MLYYAGWQYAARSAMNVSDVQASCKSCLASDLGLVWDCSNTMIIHSYAFTAITTEEDEGQMRDRRSLAANLRIMMRCPGMRFDGAWKPGSGNGADSKQALRDSRLDVHNTIFFSEVVMRGKQYQDQV